MRKFPFLVAILAALAFLTGCATPLIGEGAGGAAGSTSADGKSQTVEPLIAYTASGAIGDSEATRFSYGRQEQGSQAAPQIVLNLQPGEGATTSADYPALQAINIVFVPTMANSQRDGTLGDQQIDKLKDVVKEAGAALEKVKGRSAETPPEPPAE